LIPNQTEWVDAPIFRALTASGCTESCSTPGHRRSPPRSTIPVSARWSVGLPLPEAIKN